MYVFEKYKPQNPPHQSGEQCENGDIKQCENNVSVMTTFENSTLKSMTENWNTTAVDYFVLKAENTPDLTQNVYTYL